MSEPEWSSYMGCPHDSEADRSSAWEILSTLSFNGAPARAFLTILSLSGAPVWDIIGALA